MMNSWMVKFGLAATACLASIVCLSQACKSNDCDAARSGQTRCVGDRIETCNDDLSLSYESCADDCLGVNNLCYCLEVKGNAKCVTHTQFLNQTVSATAATTKAASSTAAGMGGMGGAGGTTATGTATASSGMGGGVSFPDVNACKFVNATDQTMEANPHIAFDVNLKYTPPCLKIKAGQKVTFLGVGTDFSAHPLVGGTVSDDGSSKSPDPNSPIKPTSSGTTAAFTFPSTGEFPYYCDDHFSFGMKGAIFVVP